MKIKLLQFTWGNAKLEKTTAILSLPAGHSCPGAMECLTKADQKSGQITDGAKALYRCYAAIQEAAFPNVRRLRWQNYMLLREAETQKGMQNLIMESLMAFGKIPGSIRIHGSGDFFNAAYFNAWCDVAADLTDQEFYAYTKAANYWGNRIMSPEGVPANMRLVASRGGKHDHLIDRFDLPETRVVNHPSTAEAAGLEIDHDDSLARDHNTKKFALLLHGNQKAGTDAAKDLAVMRAEGISYSYK